MVTEQRQDGGDAVEIGKDAAGSNGAPMPTRQADEDPFSARNEMRVGELVCAERRHGL